MWTAHSCHAESVASEEWPPREEQASLETSGSDRPCESSSNDTGEAGDAPSDASDNYGVGANTRQGRSHGDDIECNDPGSSRDSASTAINGGPEESQKSSQDSKGVGYPEQEALVQKHMETLLQELEKESNAIFERLDL